MKRAIVIVCDSLGVGELPDAADFGDEGSNTLGHILQAHHPSLPTLARLGLLHTLPEPAIAGAPVSAYGRMKEISSGKDTITGHWEMMGLVVADPFRTYPNGFPPPVFAGSRGPPPPPGAPPRASPPRSAAPPPPKTPGATAPPPPPPPRGAGGIRRGGKPFG